MPAHAYSCQFMLAVDVRDVMTTCTSGAKFQYQHQAEVSVPAAGAAASLVAVITMPSLKDTGSIFIRSSMEEKTDNITACNIHLVRGIEPLICQKRGGVSVFTFCLR